MSQTIDLDTEFDELIDKYEAWIALNPEKQEHYFASNEDSIELPNPLLRQDLTQHEKNCIARAIIWRRENPNNS
ncbi:hypothetical protein J4456_02490 [Candidatus Pacearchaeota archaeon]|nr:hypothetical protein [Candidatus Pacearchaeota archaeon]